MEALGKLGINLTGLVGQAINFFILLLILYFFAYKRIIGMLDERSRRVRESMEQAEFIKQETARVEQQVQAQLAAARQEGQNLVAQAAQIGERLREEARGEARREAEAILSRTRSQIDLERDAAMTELRRQFVDLAIMAAEKVISRSLDKEAHRQLINEVLEEAGQKSGG